MAWGHLLLFQRAPVAEELAAAASVEALLFFALLSGPIFQECIVVYFSLS